MPGATFESPTRHLDYQSLLCTLTEEGAEDKADKGQPMETGERGGKFFVVTGETTEAGGPGEGALHHPAPGQKHEPAFGFLQLHHFESDPGLGRWAAGSWPV